MASAILLRAVLPDATIQFVQYGTPGYEQLEPKPGMLFCDISPPGQRATDFIDVGAIVLDHHRTAKGIVERFGENGIFGDEVLNPGVCGATLAYEHVAKGYLDRYSLPFAEKLSRLAGIRDTWQKSSPLWKEACTQSAVLSFVPNSYWLSTPLSKIQETWLEKEWLGSVLMDRHATDVAKAMRRGRTFSTQRGTKAFVYPSKSLTSDLAEALGEAFDVIIGFGFHFEQGMDAPKMILSTRSHSNFDCATFCKAHGGGGHTKAAGCSFDLAPDSLNPYTMIETVLRRYENEL